MKIVQVMVLSLVFAALVAGCGQTMAPATGYQTIETDEIYSVKYNPDTQLLTVVMYEQGVFDFAGIPQDVYDKFMAAPEKDAFFEEQIQARFEGSKLDL